MVSRTVRGRPASAVAAEAAEAAHLAAHAARDDRGAAQHDAHARVRRHHHRARVAAQPQLLDLHRLQRKRDMSVLRCNGLHTQGQGLWDFWTTFCMTWRQRMGSIRPDHAPNSVQIYS